MQLVRDERQGGRLAVNDDRHQLVRRVRDPVAVEAQHFRRVPHRPHDRARQHGRAEGHEVELELGDDPEVAAAATEAPEEVRVLVGGRLHELAVCGDDVDPAQLVDRQAVLAHDPADPAAERQARDARVRDDPRRRGQAERLRLAVELAEQDARLHARGARLRVDTHALQQAEVDDERIVRDGQAREAVPAAPNGDRQPVLAAEPHRRDHVRHARAARDQRRPPVDRAVPDRPMLVVGRVVAAHDLSAKAGLEPGERRVVEGQPLGDRRHEPTLSRSGVHFEVGRSSQTRPRTRRTR